MRNKIIKLLNPNKTVRFLGIASLLLVSLVIISEPIRTIAMSEYQRRMMAGGVLYANAEDYCAVQPTNITPPVGGSGVYLLGDSISNQSKTELESEITAKGFIVKKINADPGRAISLDTYGSEPSGLQALDQDKDIVADSEIVVIELGTNSGAEDLNKQIPNLIAKVKEYNQAARILWVNLFYTSGTGNASRNSIISKNAEASKFSIIDTTSANIELGPDKIHPTALGASMFAKTVANGISTGGNTAVAQSSSADSQSVLSLNYPSINNESEVYTNLTNQIKTLAPSSPWLKINGGDIGKWIFDESKTRDINPLLVAVIGKQENVFGSSDQLHVTKYYNYFGMKGKGPVEVPNSGYRGFSSPEEGIRFFIDKVKKDTQSSDRGSYKDVQNLYDYLSVHQTGKITYPGEPLGSYNGGVDGFDEIMQVYISWTTTDHPNNKYDGDLFNPGIYYTSSIDFINKLTGLSISSVPQRGTSLVSNCQGSSSSNGSGLIDSTGYSFPLAPQTKAVGGIVANQTATKHHDGTPAFDLFSADSSDVYAIYSGEIIGVETSYNNIPGCSSIQLKADDGYYYWYGHLKNPAVSDGSKVTSGQKIAQIADRSFGNDCFGSAPHLHIDRGCVVNGEPQFAGTDKCRDPDFIPFLSSLYSRL